MRFITLLSIAAIALASDTAAAAPATLPNRAIDIDTKQADIRNILAMFGKLTNREVAADPCVRGTVDLRLRNTPVPLVLDALAAKLSLHYEDDGSTLRVHCNGDDAGAPTAARVSLAVESGTLADAAEQLAKAAHLEGVDYRAKTRPNVKVTLERVRLGTAVAVLADESGLKVGVVKKRLVIED